MNDKKACIMGWPVAHSRSPLIHGFWLREHGLAGDYVKQPLEPDQAYTYLRALKDHGYCGGNVTIPHKQVAFMAADRRDNNAESIGAVNTLWYEKDVLIGGNTDAYGYNANLSHDCPGWETRCETALVLGAGGAALAIIHALKQTGVQRILIANRTLEKADALVDQFGPHVQPVLWQDLAHSLPVADLIINTTSLGMVGQGALDLSLESAKATAIISDIVYVPLKTQLIRDAEARGLATSTGLGMLLHQAVPGFEHWFGVRPEVSEALIQHIIADIETKA